MPRKQPTSRVDATITGCRQLTIDGEDCGKPGEPGLPVGICPEHAVQVFRAVNRLIEEKGDAA